MITLFCCDRGDEPVKAEARDDKHNLVKSVEVAKPNETVEALESNLAGTTFQKIPQPEPQAFVEEPSIASAAKDELPKVADDEPCEQNDESHSEHVKRNSLETHAPPEGEEGVIYNDSFMRDGGESKEPLQAMHAIVMFLGVVIPNAALVLCFSAQGLGLEFFNLVSNEGISFYGDCLLCGAVFLGAFFIVCDWWRMPLPCKIFTSIFPALVFCAGTACKGRKYPWAPILLTLFFMPAIYCGLRATLCKKVNRNAFYGWLAVCTVLAALTVLALWCVYILQNPLDASTESFVRKVPNTYRYSYEEPLEYGYHCGPDRNETMLKNYPKDKRTEIKTACSQANTVWWLAWLCPVIAVGCDLLICTFCLVTGYIGKHDEVSSIQKTLTRFVLIIAFLLTGMYGCATMSATSVRLGSTLMAFFFTAIALLFSWAYMELDLTRLFEVASHSKIMQQLVAIAKSDWTKALAVRALGGPIICFLVLNYLMNAFRKCRGSAGDFANERFTNSGRKLVTRIADWNWTGIFTKIVILGEAFFTLQVGVAKLTYIFLSWLNVTLAETSMAMVCVLVFIIGSCMFLLPPVPGLPVYVFAGILLGEKGRQNEAVGFWGGCGIATALGLFTKCCACLGQYMIGYFLGKSLKVQQLIGVDKVPTRAIEKVLKSRGLNPGKVAILVGGPDWPTSVTCGIVRVNIPQMILGTIPVVTLLLPCILAGASMGRVTPGEESNWNMVANVFTMAAAVVNTASMAYAVYTISVTVQKHGDELAKPRPEHEAVAELTRQEQAAVECYNRTVEWSAIGRPMQIALVLAVIGMLLSNMVFVGMPEMCFKNFAVSSKINDPYELDGLEGNALNIVIAPTGWGALGMFFLALLLHIVFIQVMAARAVANHKREGGDWKRGSMMRL